MPKGIIKAEALRKQMRGDEEAEEFVNEILENIEDHIHQAMDRNENIAQVEISVYFPIPFTKPDQAQRIVYFHTLKALEQAGYTPRLILEDVDTPKPRAFIIVTWVSSKDTAEKKYMDDYLKAHTVKRTQVHHSSSRSSRKSKR